LKGKEKTNEGLVPKKTIPTGRVTSSGWLGKAECGCWFHHGNRERASAGIVIRDQDGAVLITSWRTLRHAASVEMAEALSCLEGIHLALGWIEQPLHVESDCLQLVHALGKADATRAVWSGVLMEITEAARSTSRSRMCIGNRTRCLTTWQSWLYKKKSVR
jgi:hypothetical protein